MNRSAITLLKGILASLLIFFSVFVTPSFANSSYQKPVKRINKNIAILHAEKKPIAEITAGSQNREFPETPYEETKKAENETDDDTNESIAHYHQDYSAESETIDKDECFLSTKKIRNSSYVPYYILFHSWKSFLS